MHHGGIVGITYGGTSTKVINCVNYADIVSSGSNNLSGGGGIIGFTNYGATIYNCSNNGKINGENAGGILGYAYGSSATLKIGNCNNFGEISGTKNSGGILGNDMTPLYLFNCYNCGILDSTITGGVIISNNQTNIKEIDNCFFLENLGKTNIDGIIPVSKEMMQNEDFIDTLNLYISSKISDTGWAKWKRGIDGYPILDFNTIWNGTEWETIE